MPTPSLLESPGGTVNGASLNDLFKSLTAGEIRIPSAIALDSRPIVPAPAMVIPAAGITGNTDGVVRTLFKGIGGARVRNDQTWEEQGNNSAWTIPNLDIDGAVLTMKRKGGDNTAGALCTISKLTGDGTVKIDAPTVAVGVVMGQYRFTDTSEFTGDLRFVPGLGNAALDLTATQISPNMLLSLGDVVLINTVGYTLPTCREVSLLGTPRFDYDFNFGANTVTLAANSTFRVETGVTVTIGASTTFNRNGKTTSKTRPGTLVFATNNIVAGTGILSVNSGTVRIATDSDRLFTSGITVIAGATLDVTATSVSSSGVRTVTVNGVSTADPSGLYVPTGYSDFINLAVAPSTIRASNGVNGLIRGFDVNAVMFTVQAAASGSVIDSTVTVLDGGYGYRISVASGANNATGDLEIKGPIGANAVGGYGLYVNGAGHIKFTGSCPAANANSFWSFGTSFGSFTGKATFAGAFSWASGNSAMPMAFNGTIVWASSVNQTLSGVIGGTGAWTISGPGTITLSGANNCTGATTVAASRLVLQNTNTSPSYAISSGAVLEANVASGTREWGSNTTFTGAGKLEKTGAGTLQWSLTAGTFSMGAGGLIDVRAGTFIGGSNANENWTANLSDLNVESGAIFSGVEANVMVNTITGLGTISSGYSGSGYINFTFGVNNGSGTFAGVLANGSAPGNFVKAGTGTQTLSGANTYTGTTTVDGGTIVIAGASSLGTGAVTVNSGGTLTYTADTTGTRTVTVNTGGVINRGGFAHASTTFVNNGGTINA